MFEAVSPKILGVEPAQSVRAAEEQGYEPRAGGTFHPDACSTSDELVATFRVTLEERSVQLATKEGIPDVHRKHVLRVHDSIGPRSRVRRGLRDLAKVVFGGSFALLLNLFARSSGFGVAEGAPNPELPVVFTGVLMLVALGSGLFAFGEHID